MGRRPAATLLRALLGTEVGEDALTDGLCYLLQHDRAVAAKFAELLDLQGGWHCVESHTQVGVRDGRVDLEAVFSNGRERHVVLLEVKTFTPDHSEQLDTYVSALDGQKQALDASRGEVATLAPIGNAIAASAERRNLKHLTWQQVLTSIVRVAESRGGPDWRDRALKPDAPLALRDLLDYCWRLDNRKVAVDVTPLEVSDEQVARRAESLLNPHGVIGALLDGAARQLEGFETERSYSDPQGRFATTVGRTLRLTGRRFAWRLNSPAVDVTFEIWFSTSDQRACGLDNPVPGFLAGAVMSSASDAAPIPASVRASLTNPEWVASFRNGIYLGTPEYDQLWVVGVLGLAEVAKAPDIDGQIKTLHAWAAKTLDAVLAIDAPLG